MCTPISPQLFKLNNQIKFDQAINNIEHEMFAEGSTLHKTDNTYVTAVTLNIDVNLTTNDIVAKINALSGDIQKYEKLNNGEDCQSTIKQLDLAIEYIKNNNKSENLEQFSAINSIKSDIIVISATSTKSLFEVFVSIHYATIASNKISLLLDNKRVYLKDVLQPIFTNIEIIENSISIIASKSSYCTQIIFDSADYQSAFNVLSAAFVDNTAPWKIRSCWIQDTLRSKFFNSFSSLVTNARILNDIQQGELEEILKKSKQYDGKKIQLKGGNATFLVGLTKKHIDSDLCVLVNFFRTPKEVVSLVHAMDRMNCVSLWSESISLVYDVADKLAVENVWINSNGLLNPDIPFTFGNGDEKQIYGSKLGVVQMLNVRTKPSDGKKIQRFSTAVITPGKYNFQTTTRAKLQPYIFDRSTNDEVDAELQRLIDISGTNVFKTICFPFGQIFGN